MDDLNANGMICFEVNGTRVELTKEDLLIAMSQKEGYVSEANSTVTVVLDTNLSEELVEEGFVYEVISKIQTMRKDADFEVMDHIIVSMEGNDTIAAIVTRNQEAIMSKVLADEIICHSVRGISKEWNVNGESVIIGVEKV